MAQRLEGKQVAEAITQRVREKSEALRKRGVAPTLAIVRAGENPSDLSYERGAMKRAEKAGIEVKRFLFEETVSQETLLAEIDKINRDNGIHGALIFRPLPQQIDDGSCPGGAAASKRCGRHYGRFPCGNFYRKRKRLRALYGKSMYGNPGSLSDPAEGKTGGSIGTKPRYRKAGFYDGPGKKRDGYYLPQPDRR